MEHTYRCEHCGFTTAGLNTYLAHTCCRLCGYVAHGTGLVYDALADLHAHHVAAHPAEVAAAEAALKAAGW